MATILLDTSVILDHLNGRFGLDHLNGRFGRTEYLDELLTQGHLLAICPVNITEVYAGLRHGEEEKTKALLHSLEFYPITRRSPFTPGCFAATGGRRGKRCLTP